MLKWVYLVASLLACLPSSHAQVWIGAFADVQYCDCPSAGVRHYRQSLAKFRTCLEQFNQNTRLDFLVGLGDFIDRDLASYDSVQLILQRSKHNVYQVIGNHDLEVGPEHWASVPAKLGLTHRWYSIVKRDWMFIFLDGNDISWHTADSLTLRQARQMTGDLQARQRPNFHPWNGGIGPAQHTWLKTQLTSAERQHLKVALFCHFPLLPVDAHVLWNSEEILATLRSHKAVKVWFNGHNHAGNYVLWEGIHLVNLKGMVDTPDENAFAEIKLGKRRITIRGYGREPSRRLRL